MSRNRHKRSHNKEKFRKKSRTHRIKCEIGRSDIEEEVIKTSVWSKWLNFIRAHWCGQLRKRTNPLDVYTGALSAEVFDIPIEPKSRIVRSKLVPEDCGDGPRQMGTKPHFLTKRDRKFHEKEGDIRWMKNSDKGLGKDDILLTSNIYFRQNLDQLHQSTHFGESDLWSHTPESKNLNESGQKLMHMCINGSQNQIPEHSIDDINKSFSEPSWSEKAKIYHRRQVQADINNLLDQLMCIQQDFYTMQYKEPNCKKRITFGFENSKMNQKKPLRHKISRQVSPEVLVNIKPFKKQLKRNLLEKKLSLTSTTGECNINQNKEMKHPESEVSTQHKPVEKEISFQIHSSVLRSPVIIPKHMSTSRDIHKREPILLEEIVEQKKVEQQTKPEVVRSLREDFCLVFGVYRSFNKVREESSKKTLDEVLDSFDDRDHDLVFKRNISQFRKKITFQAADEKTKEEDSKQYSPTKIRSESSKIQKIPRVRRKWKVILGIQYDVAALFYIVREAFYTRRKFHTKKILLKIRRIYQLHESNIKTLIQKRFPKDTTLVVRETRAIRSEELKTMRTFRELKYCLRDVGAVAKVLISPSRRTSNIFFLTHDRTKSKQPERRESQENIIDLLTFMQEYSSLIERNYGCEEFIEIEKILSSVAKSFSSLGLTESGSESEGEVLPVYIKITVENLSKYQRTVQILNYSELGYMAVICDYSTHRNWFGKSFSEPDLHKELRQTDNIFSDTYVMEDFSLKNSGRRSLNQSFSIDGLRILLDGWESPNEDDDEKAIMRKLKQWETGPDKKKKKNSTFITCMGETKMQTCKSDSFPRKIAFTKGYRAQRSLDMFRDLYKDFKKKRKPAEKWLDFKKRINSINLGSEKVIKFENDSGKFRKPLPPDEMKYLKGNPSRKMFFIERNSRKLTKEVIAAFSIIKDLSEEKNGSKMSVVILLCKK